MIALDTNVLVRFLVNDDPVQAEAARALLEGLTFENQGFICREVALELVWVLERFYQFPRSRIADVLIELITTDYLVVETADDIARAALAYNKGNVGFADLLILSAAGRSGAVSLHTFDQRLARMEGATLVEGGTGR